jgi:hypothetical protein
MLKERMLGAYLATPWTVTLPCRMICRAMA